MLGNKNTAKLMHLIIALALAIGCFGTAMTSFAFAHDPENVSLLEELPFPEDTRMDADDADGVVDGEDTGESDRNILAHIVKPANDEDGLVPAGDPEELTDEPEPAIAESAEVPIQAVHDIAPLALADEPVMLADYPDGIDWQLVTNRDNVAGTCVWGIDAEAKTLYIRPPDGAETGTLPSLYELANDDKPATPWQTSGVKKAVILPGVIAGDRCSLFYSNLSLTEVEGLENLDITNTTTLLGMFMFCFALKEVKLPDWNAPKLLDMEYMFAMNNKLTEIKFGNMYAPNLENMEATFWACDTLETVDLSGLYAPNITNMNSTFSQDPKLVSVIWPEHLDTSKVVYMPCMFYQCKKLENLDMSGFDTSNVIDMEEMFRESSIAWLDISSFDMRNVRESHYMFFKADIKKVSIGSTFTAVDQLNDTPHWYMLEGNPCDKGRIVDGSIGTYVIVEKVVVSEATKSLPVGSSPFTLTATIVPDSVKLPVTWKSSNTSVATVDQNGKVTMHASGYANITAECLGVTGRCTVNVVSLALDKTKTVGIHAAPFKLKATLTPSSVKDPVSWTSSNPAVASISYSKTTVTVTPRSAGTTTLTVECAGATNTCDVTVVGMSMDQSSRTAYLGEDPFQLVANLDPGTVDATVLWESSDTAVATVDEHGFVTPVKKGNATITATLDGIDDVDTTCAVTVKDAIVTMDEAEKTVSVNTQPFSLGATVLPTTVTQPLAWTSSNESVATVNENGLVTVHKAGTTNITASCADSQAECKLTVVSVSLNETSKTVGVNAAPFTLEAAINPGTVTDPVTWTSSNPAVATVSSGVVTMKSAGTTTITAECDGASDTCALTVASVSLNETSKTTWLGEEPFTLKATITPGTVEEPIAWASSDITVAKVDSNGNVTPIKAGSADITAKIAAIDGTQASCALTVATPQVTLSETSKTVSVAAKPFKLIATVTPDTVTTAVTWTSSDPAVATVDSTGEVAVHETGTATITATVEGATAVCTVDVERVTLELSSIEMTMEADFESDPESGSDSEPITFELIATASPPKYVSEIMWSSFDETVATVNPIGPRMARAAGDSVCTVTVHGIGATDLKASIDAEDAKAEAVCKLTVKKPGGLEGPENPDRPNPPSNANNTGGHPNMSGSVGSSGGGSGDSQEPGVMIGPSYALKTKTEGLLQTGDDSGPLRIAVSAALLSVAALLFLGARRCFLPQTACEKGAELAHTKHGRWLQRLRYRILP